VILQKAIPERHGYRLVCRFWSRDGQPFRNRIKEGLPTILPKPG